MAAALASMTAVPEDARSLGAGALLESRQRSLEPDELDAILALAHAAPRAPAAWHLLRVAATLPKDLLCESPAVLARVRGVCDEELAGAVREVVTTR